MKLANLQGRATIVLGAPGAERGLDVEAASQGRFGPEVAGLYSVWAEFRAWAEAMCAENPVAELELPPHQLDSPSPQPSQIVAIGLNYAAHAAEIGLAAPTDLPPAFPKWPSALTGAYGDVVLPEGGQVDWEVEVVAVIGRSTHRITAETAWDHIAGLSVGQDLSERRSQMAGPAPQFGLAKSYPKFAPVGPWLVTIDELPDRDHLNLGCSVDGQVMQQGNTSRLLVSIPNLVARLSQVLVLQPGDLIFTGTPDGVGMGLEPPRFLRPGEVLRTWVDGIGAMEHWMIADPHPTA